MSPSTPQREELDLATRNHGLRPGVGFQDSIELDGWEKQSLWGWDHQTDTFYAQLWRNENRGDAPDVWLSGESRPLLSPECVVREMVARLDRMPFVIMNALGLRDPDPVLPSREAIGEWLHDELDRAGVDLADDDVRDEFIRDLEARGLDGWTVGTLSSLLWLAGQQRISPVSTIWFPPVAEAVCAERLVVAGYIYADSPDNEYLTAAHRVLHWDGVST